jgi:outer membrane receptor for ferrienterochelin and colicins
MATLFTLTRISMSASTSPRLIRRLLLASPVIFSMFNAYAADEQVAPQAPSADTTPVAAKPAVAAAKPAAAAVARPGEMQKVEIKGAAESYDARRNDTATKIVVSQEEILRNGDTTVGEVLKRLPGVTVGGVQGRGGDIRMRGLGSGYTQVMLNGEPSPPGFSLDSLTPDMIERIEIMRAATAEYSTQAIAGAINIVLKRAIVTAQRELKIGAQEDNGKFGTSANWQVSDRKGPLSYAVGGGITYAVFDRPSEIVTQGSNPAGAQTLLRHSDEASHGHFEALNLSPRVNFTLSPLDTFTSQSFINVNRFDVHNTEQIATLVGALPPYSATNTDVKSSFEMLRTDLSWAHKLAQGAKLDAKLGLNYNHRDSDAASTQYDAAQRPALRRTVTSDATDKGFSSTGKYYTPVIENHALAVGWDLGYSVRDEDRIQRETVIARPSNLDQVFNAKVSRLALFAQDEWNITQRWSVYFGLRWEGIETKSTGSDYAPVDNKSSVWSPLFQTLWKLPDSKNDQLRLAVTRTYKAPSVNALIPRRFASNNNTVTSPDQQGNPLLKPELAWGVDVGYEHYLTGGGLLTASTYVRRIQDIMHNEVSLQNGLWVTMPVNAGVANTHGIELEAKLPLRSVWAAGPAVEMRANLSRNWSTLSTVPGPNNRLDGQTPVSGTVGADYKMDGTGLTFGGSYSFQSGGPVRATVNQFSYTVPKRSLDLYTLWKFSPKDQVRISYANALHQNNIAQAGYTDATGTQSDTTITPTTAVARVMLEMKF